MKRVLSALCGVSLALTGIPSITGAQTPTTTQAQTESLTPHRQSRYSGKDWNSEKAAREAFAQHAFNQQRLQQARRANAQIESSGPNVTDVADVSVVTDDGSITIPAKPFNLTGRSVLFTPNDSGYSVTAGFSAYDRNFGTKLNLTTAPAVNPKLATTPGVEAGDDAYIELPLGFGFNFYGTTYSSVAISSNGYVTFRPLNVSSQFFDDNAVDSGEAINALQTALPRIAPYWHDLDARAVSTTGSNGIYIRNDANDVVITWNNVRDFPNTTSDNGVHRLQMVLYNDGRILFNYDQAQLTSTALTGISGGGASPSPQLTDFANPTANLLPTANAPLAEYFTTTPYLDEINALTAFYTAHPNQDNYDFLYVALDFDYNLGNNTFAYYQPIRNAILGNGQGAFDSDPDNLIGSKKIRGFLEMNDLNTQYPDLPTTRFLGANHALSIFGQEQGHYWLTYVASPIITPRLYLGRDNEHWSFFFNSESTSSQPAAPRSSNSEGNVWRDNGNNTFTSVNLIDGYSKLDQYLMGLRSADQVTDTFVLANVLAPFGVNRTTSPYPGVTVAGVKVPVTINQITQANGQVTPLPTGAQQNYRAAVLLIEPQGQQPSAQTLNKLTRYRLAWESYFAQSTNYLATINTGLADLSMQRFIAVTNGADFMRLAVPGEISSIFGQGFTNGNSLLPTSGQPLPTNLGGVEVKVDGTSAPLFYVGPNQINFQLPLTTAATTTLDASTIVQSATSTVEIFSNGQLIRAGTVQVAPAQLSVFTTSQNGQGPAAALDAITFTPAPFSATQANGQPNFIAVYATGLGADATDTDGNMNGQVQATLNGQAVAVQYAGRAPGYVGLNQINIQVPANLTSGTYPLTVTRNGFAANVTTITIQ